MSILAGNIKSLLSVKIKPRHDSYTDQVSRIIVTKMFVVSSLLLGVDFFNDNVACQLPKNTALEHSYAHSACWIQGFYVYPEMENYMEFSAYYGIPQYVQVDGVWNGTNNLCRTTAKLYKDQPNCVPMKKFYFVHYQWMPFLVSGLSVIFYLPYVLFRLVNTEMISLCSLLKEKKIDVDDILHTYFDYSVNSVLKMKLRVVFNLLIKFLYICVNVSVFSLFNYLLNKNFLEYGIDWTQWATLHPSIALDFSKLSSPKPGDRIFPTFAFCDLFEATLDSKSAHENKNKFLCELSSNILYQYVMLFLWFVLVVSTLVSCLGVLLNIGSHIFTFSPFLKKDASTKYVYKFLTLRECEYCEKIRRTNLHVYGKVIRRLIAMKGDGDEATFELCKSEIELRGSVGTLPSQVQIPENPFVNAGSNNKTPQKRKNGLL